MLPRSYAPTDDIDEIKARNKHAATDSGLQPINLRSRADLDELIHKLILADALLPDITENCVTIGYKRNPSIRLEHQFVVTVEGDTLLRSDIIARQERGLSFSRFKLKHVTEGKSIPLQEFGNNTNVQVYNDVLAEMILSFKPLIKDYVHIILPTCPITTQTYTPKIINGYWTNIPDPQPHDGKNIIFIVGHKTGEATERCANLKALSNSAAQSLINLHLATANLHLEDLKEYEAAHHAHMPVQTHSDMVDTINGLEQVREQIESRLTELNTLLVTEENDLKGKKEDLANQEMELARNYVKPARKHATAALETTQQVQQRLNVASAKKKNANETLGMIGFFCMYGVGIPALPFAFFNKWAKRATRNEYRAMFAYKEFMDKKGDLLTQYDDRLAMIEQLKQELSRGIAVVEVTEQTMTTTITQAQEEQQIVVPTKGMR